MNDWELFEAMNEAEKRFEALKAEFRARGLHNKPFYEYSHSRPTKRAPDAGDSAASTGSLQAQAKSALEGNTPFAPAQVA